MLAGIAVVPLDGRRTALGPLAPRRNIDHWPLAPRRQLRRQSLGDLGESVLDPGAGMLASTSALSKMGQTRWSASIPKPSGGGVVRNITAMRDGTLVLACSGVERVASVRVQ